MLVPKNVQDRTYSLNTQTVKIGGQSATPRTSNAVSQNARINFIFRKRNKTTLQLKIHPEYSADREKKSKKSSKSYDG